MTVVDTMDVHLSVEGMRQPKVAIICSTSLEKAHAIQLAVARQPRAQQKPHTGEVAACDNCPTRANLPIGAAG
jgi:hypothetical protein